MRSPHRIATLPPDHNQAHPSDGWHAESVPPEATAEATAAPYEAVETTAPLNPYDELAALATPNPLEQFLHETDDEDEAGKSDAPWQPPNHRRGNRGRGRRRTRFAGLPLAAKAVVALVVLAAFLALGDRWALLYAEHEAADKLKDSMHLSAAPEVDIEGFPFLTQVLDKRVDKVKVTVPDVAADRISLAQVSATGTDVKITGDGPTDIKGALISEMNGEVMLSFDDLNRELGASQVTFSGHGHDQVLARGTLPVAGHDLKLRADARIERNGDRGISTDIGRMSLQIGDLATYRPGTRESEGLHLSKSSADRLAKETAKAKALLSVPSIVKRLGVSDSVISGALKSDTKLNELVGSPRFINDVMGLNLIDVAMGHPELLKKLGLDPALLKGLSQLTRPVLADRLTLAFQLPKLPGDGHVWLKDVNVQKDGIRVRLTGTGLSIGK
ncbi:LmeA family phospholipid-binding protein [Streptomyces sp. NPDC055189]